MSDRIDWSRLMRLGLGVLRLPPDAFWAMTPREFQHALEGSGVIDAGGSSVMTRSDLDQLMAQFPDMRDP